MASATINTLTPEMVVYTNDVTCESYGPYLTDYVPMMEEEGYKLYATTLPAFGDSNEYRGVAIITNFFIPNLPGTEDGYVFAPIGTAVPKQDVRVADITVQNKRIKGGRTSNDLIHRALRSELKWDKKLGTQVSFREEKHKKMFKSYTTFTDIVISGTPASIARIKSRVAAVLIQL